MSYKTKESNIRSVGKRLMREASGEYASIIRAKLEEMDTEDLIRAWNTHIGDGNQEIRVNDDEEMRIVLEYGCNGDWGVFNSHMKDAIGNVHDDYFMFDQLSGFTFYSEDEAREQIDLDELADMLVSANDTSFLNEE